MELRTCNIIQCCKGNGKYAHKAGNTLDAICMYMGEECLYKWQDYSDRMIEDILKDALFDYIDGCERPSCILRDVFRENVLLPERSLSERICDAFALVQVLDVRRKVCVNGFTQEQLEESDRVLEVDL